jgi:predicted nucleic acid-binding protein
VIIVLDSGPPGLLTHHKEPAALLDCYRGVRHLVNRGVHACLPEIVDYETRREAIRRNSTRGLDLLDDLPRLIDSLPIETVVMRRAAERWAQARQRGRPTADNAALDADVILAAQAQLLYEATGDQVVVASDNIRHLAQFVDARRWQEIEL